jgi:hypothetical protein
MAAWCGQGDGYLAQCVNVALTTGFLKCAGNPEAGIKTLFAHFKSMSTVSGSSWYLSSLLYSQKFVDLQEKLATVAPGAVGQTYHDGWVDEAYRPKPGASIPDKLWADVLEAYGDNGNYGVLASTLLTWEDDLKHVTWLQYVEQMLLKTAGIDQLKPLGAVDVPSWGLDKIWLCNISLVTPTPDVTSQLWRQPLCCSGGCTCCGTLTNTVSYTTDSTSLPTKPASVVAKTYLPAAFSVKIGSGVESPAPVKFVTSPSITFKYSGVQSNSWLPCCCPGKYTATSSSLASSFTATFEGGAGKLPVASCVAASSAFLCFNFAYGDEKTDYIEGAVNLLPMPPVSPASAPEASFKVGADVLGGLTAAGGVTQASLDGLASKGVFWLADAGATDSTGIALAVANGATEVFAVTMDFNKSVPDTGFPQIWSLSQLCEGGSIPGGPIFSESWSELTQKPDSDFFNLSFPQTDEYTLLTQLTFGSVTADTLKNDWFGTQGNQSIKVNFVYVTSPLGIGDSSNDNFNNYDKLISAIVSTMCLSENTALIQKKVLKPMFSYTGSF